MIYVDANIFLRYILNDNQEMANFAENLLNNGNAFIYPEVLAEMVYVLTKVYNIERNEVCEKLTQLLDFVETTDKDVMKLALKNFSEIKLDFVDCILLAQNKIHNFEIATFDKKLKNKMKK